MSRWTSAALALLVASLATVVLGALHLIRNDRAELVHQFADEHLDQVDQAARILEEDLSHIGEDLQFSGELVRGGSTSTEHERELLALLTVVDQYRLLRVYDERGRELISVADPRFALHTRPALFEERMREAAASAMTRSPGEVLVTAPLRPASEWIRVFAMQLPPEGEHPALFVAMLVDTAPLFDKLRLVASSPDTRLLLLGPYGSATPLSDPALAASFRELTAKRAERPGFAAIITAMRRGDRGSQLLPREETEALGLGPAPAVAAYASVSNRSGGSWAIATLSSTARLDALQHAIVLRLGLASGFIAITLIGLGAYIVLASRRDAAMRERLKHASALAHLHEKTEKILDHIPTGVMAIAEDGRISAVNRALLDRCGAGAIGGGLADAFPDAPAAVIARLDLLIEAARREGRARSLHGERLALFGEEGQYSLHAVPLEPRFPEARVLLVVEDLSEVRSLASQLLRAEKLATVGVLAAGVAHEIGTPLAVVRGRAEYMLGKLGPDHAQAAGMRIIVEQIDVVTRTIRKLLDFSRVRPSVVSPVEVAKVARAVLELLRYEAERRKLTIDAEVAGDLSPVAANADELQQTLVNLVINACDACAPGGHVHIAAAIDRSPDPTAFRRVRIDVTDDGHGIPEEHRAQVFDPFFTTKKRGQGTGLGLTIAAQIVRNHGGSIELESAPGRGTRVTLLWPAASQATMEEQRVSVG